MTRLHDIRPQLLALADSRYREFQSALLPGTPHVLGVRIPLLRKLAKELAGDEEAWKPLVADTDTRYYEETLLQGMVIGTAKMPFDKRKAYIEAFVPRIDNWAVCDVFCGELRRTVKREPEAVWEFIQCYTTSRREFEVRFGIVMQLHYVDAAHIDHLLAAADRFDHPAYYARMAMAWLLSICYVKFRKKTLEYLQRSKLDPQTYNKTLQKAIESLRVDNAEKELLRSMKRK